MRALTTAAGDPAVLRRYRRKLVEVPGSTCLWWEGAISGRGHGRFWVTTLHGRDLVVIAHRFAWALTHGVASLDAVPVLGHRCDNPLCQRIDTGHVEPSTATLNRQAWAMRRHTIGGALRDTRGTRTRCTALRDALLAEPTATALDRVGRAGLTWDLAQIPLWPASKNPTA